uniref:Uncharacterized protein n=1 Tax=Anguilla anguilla TaxID=7936 RepID=A0A0E9Q9Y2_ANGAN
MLLCFKLKVIIVRLIAAEYLMWALAKLKLNANGIDLAHRLMAR